MSVSFTPLGLDGLLEIRPQRIADDRGFFSETWNARRFREAPARLGDHGGILRVGGGGDDDGIDRGRRLGPGAR